MNLWPSESILFVGLVQKQLDLFVGCELDGGVGSNAGHRSSIASPQRQKAIVLKSAIQELPRLLERIVFIGRNYKNRWVLQAFIVYNPRNILWKFIFVRSSGAMTVFARAPAIAPPTNEVQMRREFEAWNIHTAVLTWANCNPIILVDDEIAEAFTSYFAALWVRNQVKFFRLFLSSFESFDIMLVWTPKTNQLF